jgi:Tol biopolymer transport system component
LAKRTITTLLGAAATLLLAAPAHAALVYVKQTAAGDFRVYVADDDGSHPHRLGLGRAPTVSPDGRWVAWIAPGDPERVMLRLADRSRKAREVGRSNFIGELRFSPDSKSLGLVLAHRLYVYDIRDRKSFKAASGNIRGYSFSADSTAVVFGTSGRDDSFDAPSDLYRIQIDGGPRVRVTRDRKSLNPLWGQHGIVHDRQRRRGADAPSYNLFEVQPDGGSLRRITALRIPQLVSGLIPLELSADGKRLLAEFVGQDTSVGFAVNAQSGTVRALSRDSENGFVAANLSADGRTVLGHTGGPDPGRAGNVVTMPYRGGKATVLVRHAAFPDWSR